MSVRAEDRVGRGLRVDITESERARTFQDRFRRNGPGYDAAEKAVSHGPILACSLPAAGLTYMVSELRFLGARPADHGVMPTAVTPHAGPSVEELWGDGR